MLKFTIYLFALFNLYYCEEPLIFEVNPLVNKEVEYNVKQGQEFIIKLVCSTFSYVFLNKNQLNSLTFIKSDYKTDHDKEEKVDFGRRGSLIYLFKANSPTTEPSLLKFTDAYSYLKQENPIPKLVVKINIS